MRFGNLSTLLIGTFLIELTFLSQMSTLSRNLNHHWKCREKKENFQTILAIIFCNLRNISMWVRFTTSKTKLYIQYRKPGLWVTLRVLELLRTYDLRQLENIGKISNSGGGIAQRPPPEETRPQQQQLKNTQK